MFICEACAKNYRLGLVRLSSYGPCEDCRQTAACYDLPSDTPRYVPPPGFLQGLPEQGAR